MDAEQETRIRIELEAMPRERLIDHLIEYMEFVEQGSRQDLEDTVRRLRQTLDQLAARPPRQRGWLRPGDVCFVCTAPWGAACRLDRSHSLGPTQLCQRMVTPSMVGDRRDGQ